MTGYFFFLSAIVTDISEVYKIKGFAGIIKYFTYRVDKTVVDFFI